MSVKAKKNIADIAATNALEAQRKAQTLKAQSDMEQGILNGASLRGYRNGELLLSKERNNIRWANHNETKTHHRNTEEIQKSKSSGGSGGKGSVFDIGNIDIFGGESPRQQVKKEFKEK